MNLFVQVLVSIFVVLVVVAVVSDRVCPQAHGPLMSTRAEGIWIKRIQCIRTELKDQELNKNKNKKGTRTRELMWM